MMDGLSSDYLSRVLSAEESDLSPVGDSGGQQLYILIPSAKYGIYISIYISTEYLADYSVYPVLKPITIHMHVPTWNDMRLCLFVYLLLFSLLSIIAVPVSDQSTAHGVSVSHAN